MSRTTRRAFAKALAAATAFLGGGKVSAQSPVTAGAPLPDADEPDVAFSALAKRWS
jgi:hypothetical protein